MKLLSTLLIGFAAAGCTSFATVRSAQVTPGVAANLLVSVASPPGDDAAWFWSFDCADNCNHAIPSVDLAVSVGDRFGKGMLSVGGGIDGLQPYVEVFSQFSTERPIGIGARAGIPVWENWNSHQLYLRSDFNVKEESRWLWNPGIFYHSGRSPNGENPGSFIGFVNGFGLETGAGPVTLTPSASVIWGRAQRNSYGEQYGPTHRLFLTGAIGIGWRREPKD